MQIMAGMLYNRMQNLHVAGGNCENKFYHYCYVCNTQLNSCKQALLHCSGKRHRKKLQFLQARKTAQFGGSATPISDAERAFQFPPPPTALAPPPTLVNANPAGAPVGPALVTAIAPGPPPGGQNPTPAAGCFYPIMAPVEHWLPAPAPPSFVHFHGQFGAVPNPALFQHNPHMHAGQFPPPRMAFGANANGAHMQPRPLLRYNESLTSTTGTSSPIMLTDTSAFGSGSSTGARSAVISPSETSSLSSESISNKTRLLYRCQVCMRQFVTNTQLQVHLQTSRHYKQYLLRAGSHTERTGDSSETDSSSSSIYYCMFCNIAVNSPTQLEAHIASHKHKRLSVSAVRAHSRSSSTSSEAHGELIMDSGYVSGSGDELICISHPTPETPTAKFRCQICNIFLNSPAQAKQHLNSQKHVQRVSIIRPSFRRKSTSSFKKKQSSTDGQKLQSQPDNILTNENDPAMPPTADDDFDENEDEDDDATLVRCHSL